MIPFYSIFVNGIDRTQSYDDRLISLTVTNQSDSNSDRIELTIANPGWKIETPKRSDKIVVSLGCDKNFTFNHAYTVDGVSVEGGPDKVTIGGLTCPFVDTENTNKATPEVMKAMQVSKSRSFDNKSIAVVVKTIANEDGIKVSIDPYFESIVDHFDQTNESDNVFLKRLAREYGGMYKISSGCKTDKSPVDSFLVFARASSGLSPTGKILDVATIDYKSCGVKPGWKANLTARTDFTGVKCFYHDPNTNDTPYVLAGSEKKVYTIKSPSRNKEHAQHWANSLLKDLFRGSQSITFETPALLNVTAEQFVQLKNFHPSLNTKWLVKCITYTLTKNEGLVTKFELEIPST
jgi:uncharacterized protein